MEERTEGLIELAQQLQHKLDVEVANSRLLAERNDHLKQEIADAEVRAQVAERRANEADEKRAALESLTSSAYKSVVTELFDEPSRRAARHTASWAVLSILIGFFATLYSVRSASKAGEHFTRTIDAKIAHYVGDYRAATSTDLRDSEQRVQRALREAIEPLSEVIPPPWAVSELPRNWVAQRTLSGDRDYYFRVSVPAEIKRLELHLWSVSGNADLYLRYGELPVPGASTLACSSANTGASIDSCLAPLSTTGLVVQGDWYIRIHGAPGTYSTFVLQVSSS